MHQTVSNQAFQLVGHFGFSAALTFLCGSICAASAPAPLSHKQSVVIAGSVFDDMDRVAPGVKVSLAPVLDDYEGYDLRLGRGKLWAKPVATTSTGGDGRYTLKAAAGTRWRILVEHPDWATVTRRLEPLFEDREMEAVKLRPASLLEVRIKARGKPVKGARVMAYSRANTHDQWPYSWTAAATDKTGCARLRVASPSPWRIEVVAKGLPPVETEHCCGLLAEVDLPPASRLDLRLLLHSGKPAAAMVALVGKGVTLTKTGRKGRASLFGAPGSRQVIKALTSGGAALESEVIFPGPGQTAPRLTLELLQPRHLTVYVTTASHVTTAGQVEPVAGASAWGRDDRTEFGDARGRVSLRIPATDKSISLNVAAPGHLPWRQKRLSLSVAQGQSAVGGQSGTDGQSGADGPMISVNLEPAAAISGRVVDGEGRPVEGVAMEVMPEDNSFVPGRFRLFLEGRDGRTGADGRFVLGSLPTAERLRLTAQKAGYAPAYLALEPLVANQTHDVEIVLPAGRRVFGTVVDKVRRGVAGATVELHHHPAAAGDSRQTETRLKSDTVTDAAGRFEFQNLGAGAFDLRISANGFVGAVIPGVEIGEGDDAIDLGALRLERGLPVTGRIVDESGLPLRGATVEISRRGAQSVGGRDRLARTTSDADGRFTFADRAAGAHQVRALLDGFLEAESGTFEAPLEKQVILTMRRGVMVGGRVINSEGVALASARVHSFQRTGGNQSRESTSDQRGIFQLVGLAPGEHQLKIEAEGFRSGTLHFQVVSGEKRQDLEVVLERGATVAGQISWPEGGPVAKVPVRVKPGDGKAGFGRSGNSNINGLFEIDEVPLGPSVVVARLGLTEVRQKIEVQPGQNMVLLVMPSGVEVSGRITEANGEPVGMAQVSLQPTHGTAAVWSDDDGSFQFSNVVPGSYRLQVQHPRYANHESESKFVVGDEPTAGIEAHLRRGAVVSGTLDLEGFDQDSLSNLRLTFNQVSGPGRSGSYSARPNHEGRFRVEHVLPGQYRAKATLGQVMATGSFELPVGVETLEIQLQSVTGVELRGRVLRGGLGVPNAHVGIATDGRSISARTADDGGFVLERVLEGQRNLVIRFPDGSEHSRPIDVIEGRDVVVDLPAGEVSGKVHLAETGEALAGARIHLESLQPTDLPTKNWRSRSHRRVSSDAMGTFVLRGVESGRYRLRAEKSGFTMAMVEVEVGPIPLRGVKLELGPSKSLVLRPVRRDGRAVEVVFVVLADSAGRLEMVTTVGVDADGKARIASVTAGVWRLWVSSMGSTWQEFSARIPGKEIPVVLQPEASARFSLPEKAKDSDKVTLTVRDAEGRMLPGMSAQTRDFFHLEGSVHLRHLWPGQWTVVVHHPAGQTWRGTFTARAGETTEFSVR